jgi:hypothetical protein
MLLSMHVLMGRKSSARCLLVVIGVVDANSRTLCFADSGHGCAGDGKHRQKNDRR